jgi:hypothetical protein
MNLLPPARNLPVERSIPVRLADRNVPGSHYGVA